MSMSGLKIYHMLRCFLTAFAILFAASGEPFGESPGSLLKAVDSLFAAGRYDSVTAVIPGMLKSAGSAGDSASVAHLLLLRGRIELAGDARRAEATLEAACLTAEAAGDTADW